MSGIKQETHQGVMYRIVVGRERRQQVFEGVHRADVDTNNTKDTVEGG